MRIILIIICKNPSKHQQKNTNQTFLDRSIEDGSVKMGAGYLEAHFWFCKLNPVSFQDSMYVFLELELSWLSLTILFQVGWGRNKSLFALTHGKVYVTCEKTDLNFDIPSVEKLISPELILRTLFLTNFLKFSDSLLADIIKPFTKNTLTLSQSNSIKDLG